LQEFQTPNSFASVDSKKTLSCSGLIEYSPVDQFFMKSIWNQTIRRVLHRPVEPAGIIGKVAHSTDGAAAPRGLRLK
jgi:hypothetical protein